ncbi:DUF2382 domain-containing protein [Actinophytocola oryzae]|uniref:Uncharacterized protein (TIGR02271 family) n=1 Tax=Actinophytocola oryzae TaxID=502181 RepID=A0A4R7UPI4_9PSEU|nr:PRC and DUF2382 domain-containing protein [Actinophytocola oryzae]TDV35304.1 uncharacterized protein (TIGR02271 family) [Actinophytocola oryzae]
MIRQDVVDRLYDCQVIDPRGEKIGAVKRVWLDGQTGDPVWASVHTGLFGLKESFVPLQRAELQDDNQLRVPVEKEQVKESPRIDAASDHMTDDEQAALYRHYGFGPQGTGMEDGGRQRTRGAGDQKARQQPAAGRQQGRARRGEDAMTRSEEQMRVGTERVETGRVRLVKHVVTEEKQMNVPISHEEVRVEREPVTDANRDAAMRGQDITEAEHEVTLHAEKPVVQKEAVPVERVRLSKDTVSGEETVSGTVRKEQIDVEDDRGDRGRRGRR